MQLVPSFYIDYNDGKCFRMNRISNNTYSLVAYGRHLELEQIDAESVDFSCSGDEFHQIWEDYFDLKYDYRPIVQRLLEQEDGFLQKATEYGKGIRILRQEPCEAAH